MLLTVAFAPEYEAACTLAEHWLASGFSTPEVGLYLDGLIGMAQPVKALFRWRPQLHDPGDELVLEAAVNGRAGAIVTLNESHLREAQIRFGMKL